MARPRHQVLQRVQLHHAARRTGGDDRAVHFVPGRASDDPQTDRLQDRAIGAQRRPADASGQGRHADDGRRADPHLDRDHYPAVGRSAQSLRVGGAAHHAGFRRDRLGGRLPQGGSSQPQGVVSQGQNILAINHRTDCRRLFMERRQPARAYRTHRAIPEIPGVSAWCIPVHRTGLLCHRRYQQCGEFDRWLGWAGHHAYRNGKRRAGNIRLCGWQCGVLEISRHSLHSGCG
jgi:hypothetical protein